jgi:hypothetical protein
MGKVVVGVIVIGIRDGWIVGLGLVSFWESCAIWMS